MVENQATVIDQIATGNKLDTDIKVRNLQEIVLASDKVHFGKVRYASSTVDYYEQTLSTLLNLPQENLPVGPEMIRRPAGLTVKNFEADAAYAENLPSGQCLVAFGHGSLAISPVYREGTVHSIIAGLIKPKVDDKKLTYYDPAKTQSGDYVRGIKKKTLKRLQAMSPIDISLKRMKEREDRKYLDHQHYSEEERRAIDLNDLTTSVLKNIAKKVDWHVGSQVAITESEDRMEQLLQSHMQCGANGGSMYATLREFIAYANRIIASNSQVKLIPAIELAEGLVMSVNIDLLREGRLGLSLYDQAKFKDCLEANGLTIGAEVHCVDDRAPFCTDSHTHQVELATHTHDYNSERKNSDYIVEKARTEGELMGTHHAAVVVLCSDSPEDRAFASKLSRSTQVLCGCCSEGYFPQSIDQWKTAPANHESLSNTSGALVYCAPSEQVVDSLSGLPSVYNAIGAGAAKQYGAVAWEGSHLFTRRALRGLVIGTGDLKASTLIRPPVELGSESAGPLIIVTESIINAAGGLGKFMEAIHVGEEKIFYSAIAVVNPANKSYELVHVNEGKPKVLDRFATYGGGFYHSERPLEIDQLFRSQASSLWVSPGEVESVDHKH